MRNSMYGSGLGAMVATFAATSGAWAQETLKAIGVPVDGATAFQPAATIVARHVHGLEHLISYIMGAIVLLVTVLLLYVIVRFNKRSNPTPAKFTHNTPLEIAWTLIPVVILVIIGAYSLPVLFLQEEIPKADVTIKVTGNQWYWHYDYADAAGKTAFGFDSYMLGSPATLNGEDEKAGAKAFILNDAMKAKLAKAGYTPDEFRLAVDNAMVVPVGKTVVLRVTGADVIHSWTVPAFGVKQDAVPGRIAELWFRVDRPGIYFGQCSELCGKDHAFMPIEVKAVSEAEYKAWLEKAHKKFASARTPALVQVAAND